MNETKYGKYFVRNPTFDPNLANIVEPQTGKVMTGRTRNNIFMANNLVPGSNIHLNLMWIYKVPSPNPFVLTHSHQYDEILFFLGTNPNNLEGLGGELTLEMGDEKHVVKTTTAVFIPKGLPHLLVYNRVDRPQMLVALSLSGEYK